MLRLGILILATLGGLYVALTLLGGENLRKARPVASVDEVPEPEPTLPATVEAAEPVPVVPASQQTPEQVQRFPGPDLQPSPEHEGRTPVPPPEVAADAPRGAMVYVTGNDVRFRAGPSANDDIIGSLPRGAPVEALGPTDADWVNIRDAQGRFGYISGQFLSAEAPN
jgi:hypothetical protein